MTEKFSVDRSSVGGRTRSSIVWRIRENQDLLLQRGKATNMPRGNLTGLVMRIDDRRIRYPVNRSHKQQQTKGECDHVSEFHITVKQG